MAGGLLTDLYELNMAASYLRRGMNGPATFSLFVRASRQTRGSWSRRAWKMAIAYFDLTPSHLARPRGRNTRHSEDYRHLDVSQCFGMCGGPSAGTFGLAGARRREVMEGQGGCHVLHRSRQSQPQY